MNAYRWLSAFVISAALAGPVFAGERLAVVVGVNDYDMLAKLNGAVNDAERVSAYYTNLGFRVWTLSDRQEKGMNKPSLGNLERVLANVAQTSEETVVDELVFFFAGHGVQVAGANYLCLPEAQPTDLGGMVSVDSRLVPWLRDLKAGLTMVYLDACRNDLGPVRAAGITRGLEVKAVGKDGLGKTQSGRDRSMAVFYASKSGEFSFEKPDGTGGFFTDTLLEALNTDTTATVGELFDYIRQALPVKTEGAYGQVQIPRLGGDLDLSARFTKGKVDQALLDTGGRLYVETNLPGSEVWVNGIKRGASPLFIDGLSPGTALVESKTEGYYASTQVTIVRRTLGEVRLELREVRGTILLASLSLSTQPEATKKAIDAALVGTKVLLDGDEIGELSGTLIPNVPVGRHVLTLASGGWLSEQALDVKANETAKIQVILGPSTNVSCRLPEGVSATLVRADSGLEYPLSSPAGTPRSFPAGEYVAVYRGENYVGQDVRVSLVQGKPLVLQPELKFTERWAATLDVQRLRGLIASGESDLRTARTSRSVYDTLGWLTTGLGLGLGAASGISWSLAADAYARYQKSDFTQEAVSLRHETSRLATIGFWLAVAGGTTLATSGISFALGPRTQPIQRTLDQLNEEIGRAQGRAGVE